MIKGRLETEYAIVGSGTAGATLAKELSKKGKKVILLEKGKREKRVGSMIDALRFYEGHSFRKTQEGMLMYGTSMVGGTSVVASGNALRCLQKEFMDLGIDLEESFVEAENEIEPAPLPDKCIASGVMKMLEIADIMGLKPQRIPKFINPDKCKQCGNCVLGCKYGAKWSAVRFVNEAVKNGITLVTRAKAERIISENGIAKAIDVKNRNLGKLRIYAEKIIISAGGIETPILLQKSGIANAGKKLFCDPFMTTYGVTKDLNQTKGVNAPGYIRKLGKFILFPVIDPPVQFHLYTRGRSLIGKLPRFRTLGMMTKIDDECIGNVDIDGKVIKLLTTKDLKKFYEGVELAKELLIKTGADPKSIFTIQEIRGPHPGGTAAIGEVVKNNLETEIKNLFVCDNSVLPTAPGLPPIMTIVALSKWLSRRLTNN